MTNNYFLKITCFCLFISCAFSKILLAQTDTSQVATLDTIQVTASRLPSTELLTPYALSVVDKFYLQTGQRQLSINEALQNVPGLLALNPDNFAQDLRVSIRGFGTRSAFGIRGIKLLVDGLPESTPDGQAQVDNLDLGAFQRVEVIRGSSAGLYGNAAGGVLSFTSESVTQPFVELGYTAGSFGLQRYQLKGGVQKGKISGFAQVSHTQTNGYRSQSRLETTQLYSYIKADFTPKTQLKLIYNYVFSPIADDPGALNRTDATQTPIEARTQNVTFDGGESVEQGKVGLIFNHQFTERQQLTVKSFFINRSFDNRLPFQRGGIVKLNRNFYGLGAQYQYQGKILSLPYQLKLGVDIEQQQDNRERFDNLDGIRGSKTLDQRELFTNTAVYLLQALQITPKLKLNASIRYDALQLEAQDQFLNDGNDSGNRSYQVWNPSIGLLYNFSRLANVYINISTSFETPTLNELSANPSGGGGFNPDLNPQTAISYELGLKGLIIKRLRYSAAIFYIDLQNELLPFELAAFPQRTFFNNVGNSTRQGLEVSLDYRFFKGLHLLGSYTFSRFVFDNFPDGSDDFSGKVLPGVPAHMGYAELRYQDKQGWFGSFNVRFNGSIFATNANDVEDPGYQLVNFRMGWEKRFNHFTLAPFFGINNLFNMRYTANLRINAFGARYFEPGMPINFQAGVKVRFQGR
ncbi:MAG TPA: hypothetical protein DCS93_44055 [Microscillaceae bacterium]|nr:hypothetical protein [Microscillaceae bacterium]